MPLDIIIVGAGIAGLSAAIALARQDHKIRIFETSSFSKEVGAAFNIAAPAVKILKSWDIDLEQLKPDICHRWEIYEWSDAILKPAQIMMNWDERASELNLTENTLAVHRADAHEVLRTTALAFPNIELSLRSPVASVDPKRGKVTVQGGDVHCADVIIGSDGIHSKALHALDDNLQVTKSSRNSYRFMVPTDKAMGDATTRAFLQSYDWRDTLAIFFDETGNRNIVMYPCRGGTLINAVTFIEADSDKEEIGDAWNNPATVDDLMKVMEGFPEGPVSLAKLGEDIKHWASGSRDCPRTFVKDRLVLIGDAAHPMPPTWTAGAGTGIEDGAALGFLLNKNTTADEVQERLALYNKARYERGVTIKYASENVGEEQIRKSKDKLEELCPGASVPEDMAKYLWTEDVISRCRLLL